MRLRTEGLKAQDLISRAIVDGHDRCMSDHCVSLYLNLAVTSYDPIGERKKIIEFEDAFKRAIDAAQAGQFAGDDFGHGLCVLHAYGSDADILFAAIQPVLRAYPKLTSGGHVIKRYGLPVNGIRKARVNL